MKKVRIIILFLFCCCISGFWGRYDNKTLIEKRLLLKQQIISEYGAQEIELKTQDGILISGLLILRPQATKTFLICHGFRQSKESYGKLIELFNQENFFLFDFRAHGESSGDKISFGHNESEDIVVVYDFLKNHEVVKDTDIYPIAFSMGCAALINSIFRGCKFKALILDSGFLNIDYIDTETVVSLLKPNIFIANIIYLFVNNSLFPVLNLIKYFYKHLCVYNLAIELDIPILFIHCKHDKVIKASSSYSVFNNIKSGNKELWIVEHDRHVDAYKFVPQDYKQKILNFIKSVS